MLWFHNAAVPFQVCYRIDNSQLILLSLHSFVRPTDCSSNAHLHRIAFWIYINIRLGGEEKILAVTKLLGAYMYRRIDHDLWTRAQAKNNNVLQPLYRIFLPSAFPAISLQLGPNHHEMSGEKYNLCYI